jgi:diaminopimelate epimerase
LPHLRTARASIPSAAVSDARLAAGASAKIKDVNMKEPIPFYKMSGSGNDFIVIDNRQHIVELEGIGGFVSRVCRRRMSAGADGLILLEDSDQADFRWHFYNSDGSRAEMCGNGARCAARFAMLNGIAGDTLNFETDAGVVDAEIMGRLVKVKMPDPHHFRREYDLDLETGPLTVCSVNTGVPHAVVIVEHLDQLDVVRLGRAIRHHPEYAPEGTNANFICRKSGDGIAIRTYERGVEDETLACGTGSIAGAIVAAVQLQMPSPIDVHTRSGEYLTISFEHRGDGEFRNIFMKGDARVIYSGSLWEESWR